MCQTIRAKALIWVLLSILPIQASAGIYSWKDDKGRIHFGDKPPIKSEAKPVTVRVNTYNAPAQILDFKAFSSAKTKQGKVVLYSTERCGYCKKAKRYFNKNNISYEEYDVETSDKGKRDYIKLKGRGVPIILVGNQRMNGFKEGLLASMLESAGYK